MIRIGAKDDDDLVVIQFSEGYELESVECDRVDIKDGFANIYLGDGHSNRFHGGTLFVNNSLIYDVTIVDGKTRTVKEADNDQIQERE